MPPVALLPFVVIIPPVEVVVHSVTLLPLAAVVLPVAVMYRPSPLSCDPSKLIVESLDVALLSLLLSSLVRHHPRLSYRAAAASLLIVVPPLPSVDCRVLSSHPAHSSPSLCHLLPCCPLSSSCRPSKSLCILSPCCPLPLSCRPSPSCTARRHCRAAHRS